MFIHNELLLLTNFGEDLSRNAAVRVRTDGYTDTPTDANRFYIHSGRCYML